ncbi:MAG: glucose-1-phosphate adenylyltransferase [Planctomycetota bacterium]|jgi:glucose-1-phosphate adenylyltransferase
MPSVTAVILGGGRGSRLYPLTKDRSKPAVPLAGKYRLIDIPISNCINSGIRKIFVLTQFNSASLNQHIAQAYRFDQFSRGFVEPLAAEQTEHSGDWFQGTADAVRQCYQHLADEPSDYVLILSGDHLYSMNYSIFLDHHRENEADLSIAVQPVTTEEAPELGILKTDSKGKIVDFIEKPFGKALEAMAVDTASLGLSPEQAVKKPYLGSMGIYLFSWKALGDALFENKDAIDFGKEIIPQSIDNRNVQAYLFDGYWEDIGTIKSFFDANLSFCTALPKFNLFDRENPVYTNTRFLPAAKLRGGLLENCIISEGCIIDGGIIKNSILGVRSRVFKDVNISETIMMGSDNYETSSMANGSEPRFGIGERSVIKRAIIDKNARVGNDVKLVNQQNVEDYKDPDDRFLVRDGIIVVQKNAVIPHGFSF